MRSPITRIARALFVSAAAFCLFLLPRVGFTSPGDLDPAFGAGGKVTTDFRGFYDNGFAAVLQSDGKIVVAGGSYRDTITTDIALARYNTDGSLDRTFGSGGKVITALAKSSGASSIVIQQDGKLLVAGGAYVGLTTKFILARYNTDGTLDPSFGTGGIVMPDFFGKNDYLGSMALQADGKIILAGVAEEDQFNGHFAMVRYTVDGTLDNTFGSQGKVVSSSQAGGVFILAVDAGGRILAGGGIPGTGIMGDGTGGNASIARFNPDGTLDTSFGTGGGVSFGFVAGLTSLAVQPDGNIVVLGQANSAPSGGFIHILLAVVRLKPDGAFDKTFGNAGFALADFGGMSTYPGAIALAPGGKIVAVGKLLVDANTDTDFAVVRFLPNGTLDSSFGAGGKVRTDFFGSFDVPNAVVIRPDGRTVVIGFARNPVTGNDFALASYQGPHFDSCLQDDATGDWLSFNSQTGEYLFTACGGGQAVTVAGIARIRVKRAGCVLKLNDTSPGQTLSATINLCAKTGSATVVTATGRSFTITDSSTSDDNCVCRQP